MRKRINNVEPIYMEGKDRNVYVIGDVHGNAEALDSVLDQISYNDETDRIYFLGDIIDRNNDGIYVLNKIRKSKNMKMLLGNHEWMMMSSLCIDYNADVNKTVFFPDDKAQQEMDIWFYNGGEVTYYDLQSRSLSERIDIFDYLSNCPISAGNDVLKLCHAMPFDYTDPNKTLEERIYDAVWDRKVYCDGKRYDDSIVIYGHTPTIIGPNKSTDIRINFRGSAWLGIDTGAAYREVGKLSCIQLNTMELIQSE